MAATYTKLKDGSWGLRVEGKAPAVGTTLSVSKKSGETKRETVGRVIWVGNGIALCSIAGAKASAADKTRYDNPADRPEYGGEGRCWECGARGPLTGDGTCGSC